MPPLTSIPRYTALEGVGGRKQGTPSAASAAAGTSPGSLVPPCTALKAEVWGHKGDSPALQFSWFAPLPDKTVYFGVIMCCLPHLHPTTADPCSPSHS